jgi:hypothetical protein
MGSVKCSLELILIITSSDHHHTPVTTIMDVSAELAAHAAKLSVLVTWLPVHHPPAEATGKQI